MKWGGGMELTTVPSVDVTHLRLLTIVVLSLLLVFESRRTALGLYPVLTANATVVAATTPHLPLLRPAATPSPPTLQAPSSQALPLSPSPSPANAAGLCVQERGGPHVGFDRPGSDMAVLKAPSAESCSLSCCGTEGCVAWTFVGSLVAESYGECTGGAGCCFLKNSFVPEVPNSYPGGIASGTVGAAPSAPPPPPAPSPPSLSCDEDSVRPRPWFRPRGLSCAADFPGSVGPPVPIDDKGVPPQNEIPVYTTGNNNPTFLWYWIRLTECYGISLRVYDQASNFPPHLALLADIERGGPRYAHVKLVRNAENRGPRFFHEAPDMVAQYPPFYAITDADLIMRPDLPSNWLRVMARISLATGLRNVGSALDVTCPGELWRVPYHVGMLVEEWEAPFWRRRYGPADMPPELAGLSEVAWVGFMDTTLAVYHPSGTRSPDGMRIAGVYNAAHGPWYSYFLTLLMPGELQAQYIRGSTLDVGSTIGKMMLRNGIMKGEQLRYEPSEWVVNVTQGRVWEYIATSAPPPTEP